jgi:hypothetical protein
MADATPDKDAIEQLESNRETIEWLARDVSAGAVIPFVGAGLTVGLGFPGWRAFLLQCGQKLGISDQVAELLTANRYEEAAQTCIDAEGPERFNDLLLASFDRSDRRERELEAALQGAIVRLPALARGPVITTNFDRVLELVFERARQPFEERVWGARVYTAIDAFTRSRRYLLKIHGDVREPSDRVLTLDEYNHHYYDAAGRIDLNKPLPKVLRLAAGRGPLLFVGCSLEADRTIAALRQITDGMRELPHYAVLARPADADALRRRRRFLVDHGIRRIIWYPDGRFDWIEQILDLVKSTARSRASARWCATRSIGTTWRTRSGIGRKPSTRPASRRN